MIKQFFGPLFTFTFCMLSLIVLMLLWDPVLATPLSDLASGSTSWTGWGWQWLMSTGVVKWLAFAIGFLATCFLTGVSFLKTRPRF